MPCHQGSRCSSMAIEPSPCGLSRGDAAVDRQRAEERQQHQDQRGDRARARRRPGRRCRAGSRASRSSRRRSGTSPATRGVLVRLALSARRGLRPRRMPAEQPALQPARRPVARGGPRAHELLLRAARPRVMQPNSGRLGREGPAGEARRPATTATSPAGRAPRASGAAPQAAQRAGKRPRCASHAAREYSGGWIASSRSPSMSDTDR